MLETCGAWKKYNKITSGIQLVFLFFSDHNDARSNKHQIRISFFPYLFLALYLSSFFLCLLNFERNKQFEYQGFQLFFLEIETRNNKWPAGGTFCSSVYHLS